MFHPRDLIWRDTYLWSTFHVVWYPTWMNLLLLKIYIYIDKKQCSLNCDDKFFFSVWFTSKWETSMWGCKRVLTYYVWCVLMCHVKTEWYKPDWYWNSLSPIPLPDYPFPSPSPNLYTILIKPFLPYSTHTILVSLFVNASSW